MSPSVYWMDEDKRSPWPMNPAMIMEIQHQIMFELYGPIHDETDVTIEMVDEVQKRMYQLYRPRWMDICHRN